jgi:hypothetical protein
MPNWCENEVTIMGLAEDITALKKLIGDKFDFNAIIPMPAELEASCGKTGCNTMVVCDQDTMLCHEATGQHGGKTIIEAVNAKYQEGDSDIISLTQAVIDNFIPCEECLNAGIKDNEIRQGLDFSIQESIRRFKSYGTDNWYDWSIANWGTKWDASEVDIEWKTTSMSAYFLTAWSPPEPIYEALVEKFPNLQINWHYNEPLMCFSGNFETATHNDFADPYDYDDLEADD